MRARIDGLLIVDKPDGITSMDVLREIKHFSRVKKVGHLGTLDPFATGVLPVVLNQATKMVPFLEDQPKEYEAVLKLGEETTTDDLTGEILFRKPWSEVTSLGIQSVFQSFLERSDRSLPCSPPSKCAGRRCIALLEEGSRLSGKRGTSAFSTSRLKRSHFPKFTSRSPAPKGPTFAAWAGTSEGTLGVGASGTSQTDPEWSFYPRPGHLMERTARRLGSSRTEPWIILMEEALDHLPEVIGDDRLVEKVRFGREMMVRDLSPHPLPTFAKGQWVKITSLEDGLVAILKSEVKGAEIGSLDPGVVALRPLRVFRSQKVFPGEAASPP